MRAFIAVTDAAWLRQLRRAGVDEANFWQPRPTPIRQAIGTPWIFKVKGTKLIAGYGLLSHYTVMPASIAWEAFGVANGAESYTEMQRSIVRLRHSQEDNDAIGCVVLSNVVVLEEAQYIPAPSDWKPNIVRGKGYDLSVEAGAVLWLQLMIATQASESLSALRELPGGFGEPTVILPRRGQGAFRLMVMDAYERRCAVSGERTLPVLEAAHIKPYAERASHEVHNGVLLRSDIHRLFDQGYVTITTDLRFRVSSKNSRSIQ